MKKHKRLLLTLFAVKILMLILFTISLFGVTLTRAQAAPLPLPSPEAVNVFFSATLTATVPFSETRFISNSVTSQPMACTPESDEPAPSGSISLLSPLFQRTGRLAQALLPVTGQTERINILLLGSDSRPDDKYGHADTIMLVTINPIPKTVTALSIPRDLWVVIPGYGEERINQAYRWGQSKGHPGGGPALMRETIETNLGVTIHYYVLVDFEGFQQIVNTLGGIEVCIPETIDAATYYGYTPQYVNPGEYYSFVPAPAVTGETEIVSETGEAEAKGYQFLYIDAGLHTLDGLTALQYARSRASVTADFARVQRQQAVLLAIRKRALQLDIIPKIPELWGELNQLIATDLTLADIIQLGQLAYQIERDNITMTAISFDQTRDYKTSTGARVLLPKRAEIKALINSIFGNSNSTAPLTWAEIETNILAVSQ